MIKVFEYPSGAGRKRLDAIIKRDLPFKARDVQTVGRILTAVQKKKDKALISYINKFDAPKLTVKSLKVTEAEISKACRQVDKVFLRSLNKAASQIEAFHRQEVERSWFTAEVEGAVLGQLVRPVDRVGVYVPGGREGKTPLVSSVLMGCIPAKIAGVGHICITTPPTKTGQVNPHVLAAARRVGVDTVFKAGSAWGVAALAYGTETVPKVDVLVGPGNIYVTLAKKLVAGTVGIDMIAGPSEILVIADKQADPSYVAADLLSQAEHDPLASAILVTPSAPLAKEVLAAVREQLAGLSRRAIAAAALEAYGALFVVSDLSQAFELANDIAPEHLELHLKEPFQYLDRIRNAGAVFLGPFTPEPVGDYIAGPNHVLPTAGTARFASALSVSTFIKKTSVVYYSEEALKRDASDIVKLAEIEGLAAHAGAVRIREK